MRTGREENLLVGSIYVFIAAIFFALMSVFSKFGKDIPFETLVFGRSFVCLLTVLPWILLPQPKSVETKFFSNHLVRALAGLGTMYTFFYSIKFIILADAVLLNNTMPLFIPFVLWIWRREKIPRGIIPGLIIGFVGVILILRPGKDIFQSASFFALASGLFMSISMAGVRELAKIEPPYRILFYYFAIASVLSMAPLIWTWQPLSPFLWLMLIGVGLSAATYQYCLTKGYQNASASKISPVIYFAVILSGVFDWFFWGIVPTLLSYIGAFLVIGGAIYCLVSERKEL